MTGSCDAFAARIVAPERGQDVRVDSLETMPEMFIQTRYSALFSNTVWNSNTSRLRLSGTTAKACVQTQSCAPHESPWS